MPSWIRIRIRIPDPDPLTRLNPIGSGSASLEVSPSRRLGACWRRCCWMRTAFSSRGPSQLFLHVFNAVPCNFLELFFIRNFFSFSSDFFHSFFSYLLNNISCFSGFSGKLVPWFCHSLTLKLFLLTSVLAYLWTRFRVLLLKVLFLLPWF